MGLTFSVARAADEVPEPPGKWFLAFRDRVSDGSRQAQAEAEEKLATARAAHDPLTEGYALLALAVALGRQHDIAGRVRCTTEAYAIAVQLKDREPIFYVSALLNVGNSAYLIRDYPTAMENFQRALDVAAKVGLQATRGPLSGLGSVYGALGDTARAVEYQRRSLVASEATGNPTDIITSLTNLGNAERAAGDFTAARAHYQRGLELEQNRPKRNRTDIADMQALLVGVDIAEGNYERAYAGLQPILEQRRTLRGKIKLTAALVDLADVLRHLGRLDEALAAIEEARSYVESLDIRGTRPETYETLARIQEARGDFAAALVATRRSHEAREAMTNEAVKSRAAELEARYDLVKKQQAIAALEQKQTLQAAELHAQRAELSRREADLARARVERWAIAAGLGAVAIALGALILAQRARRAADRRILTETQIAKEAAVRADALKSRLLAIASHDLKAPLRSMIRLGESIAAAPADGPANSVTAVTLQQTGLRMFSLVRDLIDIAALEENSLQLRRAPFPLSELVTEVVASHRPHAAEKSQSLLLDLTAEPAAFVFADRARLQQAIDNLVDNAIKFTPHGRSVHVTLRSVASRLVVEVTDEGPGMTPDDLAHAFQPFRTLSAQPTGGESSTGLGLHLVHQIVHLHGGELSVQSLPGTGTSFTLALELHVPAVAPAPATVSSPTSLNTPAHA